jgi:hypothetical protein
MKIVCEPIFIDRRISYFFFLSYFGFLFLLSVLICVHPWFHLYARAGKAAAGFNGHIAAPAERTF